MTPLPGRVLVKLRPTPKTPEGLILAPGLPPAECVGKVVQVGAGVYDVEVGDFVLFPSTVGEAVDVFPTPHLVISEAQILGVIEA
jgi:co-chaperonin GroES (HSP10)